MNTVQNLSSLAATIVYLIMPVVILFGLGFTTKFAFYSSVKEDLELQPLSQKEQTYSVELQEMQMLAVQVSTVLTWVLVVMSILSWLGKAFGFWCFP